MYRIYKYFCLIKRRVSVKVTKAKETKLESKGNIFFKKTALNVLMLSHYYFFCSFCAQKYVHNFCVYIRSSRVEKSTIIKRKKVFFPSLSPFSNSIYSRATTMYVLRNIVCYTIRKKGKKAEKRVKKKKRIISYKHESLRKRNEGKESSEM